MEPALASDQIQIVAHGIDHPKCVAVDRYGELWCGGEAGQIFHLDADGLPRLICHPNGFTAGLAFSPAGLLFVCNPAHGILAVEPTGDFHLLAGKVAGQTLINPCFGLFDAEGTFYFTDTGHWHKENGYLYRIPAHELPPLNDAPPQGELLAGPFSYPTGLALAADGKTLFLVESHKERILRFDLLERGLSEPEEWATCARFPEGLVLDAADNLYVACNASDQIWRLGPRGEKTLLFEDRWGIHLAGPGQMAFGGAQFAQLFVPNQARTTIARLPLGQAGQRLPHQRPEKKGRPRPTPL